MSIDSQAQQLLHAYGAVDDEDLGSCQAWMAQCSALLRKALGSEHPTVRTVEKATSLHLDPKAAYRRSTPNNRRRVLEACRAALMGLLVEQGPTPNVSDSVAGDVVAPQAEPIRSERAIAFVSYMREDGAMAADLVDALTSAGFDVWIDRKGIHAGDRWKDEIAQAISSNAPFLACLSAAFDQRPDSYMRKELTFAIEMSLTRDPSQPWLIPVRFDNTPLPAVPLGPTERHGLLTELHAVDWFADRTTALAQLVRVLR